LKVFITGCELGYRSSRKSYDSNSESLRNDAYLKIMINIDLPNHLHRRLRFEETVAAETK